MQKPLVTKAILQHIFEPIQERGHMNVMFVTKHLQQRVPLPIIFELIQARNHITVTIAVNNLPEKRTLTTILTSIKKKKYNSNANIVRKNLLKKKTYKKNIKY